jgi:hypothetical protein
MAGQAEIIVRGEIEQGGAVALDASVGETVALGQLAQTALAREVRETRTPALIEIAHGVEGSIRFFPPRKDDMSGISEVDVPWIAAGDPARSNAARA